MTCRTLSQKKWPSLFQVQYFSILLCNFTESHSVFVQSGPSFVHTWTMVFTLSHIVFVLVITSSYSEPGLSWRNTRRTQHRQSPTTTRSLASNEPGPLKSHHSPVGNKQISTPTQPRSSSTPSRHIPIQRFNPGQFQTQNIEKYRNTRLIGRQRPTRMTEGDHSRKYSMRGKLEKRRVVPEYEDNLNNSDRIGLLVQDPHASVFDIPTNAEIRLHGRARHRLEEIVVKNLRRRVEDYSHAKPRLRQDGKQKLFLKAGPPYPGPNPRNPALPLDKTVIFP